MAEMRGRGAWVVGLFIAGVLVGAHGIRVATGTDPYDYWFESSVGTPVFSVLGALIVSRRPANLIGRMFLAVGVVSSLQFLLGQYASSGLELRWAGASGAAALSTVAQLANVAGFLVLAFLYPTGGLPSRRWRPVFTFACAALALSGFALLIDPGVVEGFPGSTNPFGIEKAGAGGDVVQFGAGIAAVPSFFAALAALVVRWRGAHGVERLQVKLFAYGTILGVLLVVFGNVLIPASLESKTGALVWTVGPLMLPISAGVAILRYRLYDIDLVINRTLVYGALTAILAVCYAGLVFGLQTLLAPFTAESDLAIAGSTLAVAALFRPLRGAVQTFIDRRFYRRKFDARQTLEEFNTHLRDEVDLRALSSRLEVVVQETMQPAHVSLWLRGSP